MKQVKVLSLADCFDYVVDAADFMTDPAAAAAEDTLAIISIQKSGGGGYGFRFVESARCKGVLTLLFDDIERPVDGLALFSEEQARQVIAFIRAHRRDADTLLIHCYAGQSRSRAVGAFAVKLLGGDNTAYFKTGVPNAWVYDTLMRVWADERADGLTGIIQQESSPDVGSTSGLLRLSKKPASPTFLLLNMIFRGHAHRKITLTRRFSAEKRRNPRRQRGSIQTVGKPAGFSTSSAAPM